MGKFSQAEIRIIQKVRGGFAQNPPRLARSEGLAAEGKTPKIKIKCRKKSY
jgi:hypothetical protein